MFDEQLCEPEPRIRWNLKSIGNVAARLRWSFGDRGNCHTTRGTAEQETSRMQLTTYLLFEGRCRDAMAFYHAVFGGELTLTTVGESPMKDAFPIALHASVVNARLQCKLADISASDWLHPTEKAIRGNMVCLYVSGGSSDETKSLFAKLSDGANITDPLSEQPFGLYGALNDQFGIRWMFHSVRK
jgi:PhnB protein